MDEKWLTMNEAMNRANKSEATIHRWRRDGFLRIRKPSPKKILIAQSSIDDVLMGVTHKNKYHDEVFVYVIGEVDSYYVKIGITGHSVENRLRKLQTDNARNLCIYRIYKGNDARKIETGLRYDLDNYHVRFQWFCIPDLSIIDDVISNYNVKIICKEDRNDEYTTSQTEICI